MYWKRNSAALFGYQQFGRRWRSVAARAHDLPTWKMQLQWKRAALAMRPAPVQARQSPALVSYEQAA